MSRRVLGRMVAPALALALAFAVAGCDDLPFEVVDQVDLRVAHAAPGMDAAAVAVVDQVELGTLSAGEHTATTLEPGQYTVRLTVGDDAPLTAEADFPDGAFAVVLMQAGAPELALYANISFGPASRAVVINAVPGPRLRVDFDRPRATGLTAELGYGAAVALDVDPGEYDVTATYDGDPAIDLGSATLPSGRSFVVVRPVEENGAPAAVTVF